MADRLAALFKHFSATAEVFHAGALCGINTLERSEHSGQLHLVRRGPVEINHASERVLVQRPSLLLYPRPMAHRFVTDPVTGADMVCADLRFGGGPSNPISAALPSFVCMPLEEVDGATPVLTLIFEEAFAARCGREAMVNRLFEVLLIQVLRRLMESGEVRGGLLAGLAHPRLRLALVAMHNDAAKPWTLEDLAATAGMSRTAFATAFRDVMGVTPGAYLHGWRITLAQRAMQAGRPLKRVAGEVGYSSEAALSRAFKAYAGESAMAWKRKHTNLPGPASH